jgi:hypothetical protein
MKTCPECGKPQGTFGTNYPSKKELHLSQVTTGDAVGSTVGVMVCDCGGNLFMVFFDNRKLHIHCDGCNSSYQVTMVKDLPQPEQKVDNV